ncbi:MAG: V-type ATP synthase subunit A, partial [Firmicutes bacterium]|nr:V-type ATP synthase subunit A [Bacillota bacterium]
MKNNVIFSINGPVIKVKDTKTFSMLEMVFVGHKKLMGEVIEISSSFTTIQVYERTVNLKPGEPVLSTKEAISVTLGPGIINNIFDGIERPLRSIAQSSGAFMPIGSDVESLDIDKEWEVTLKINKGDYLTFGEIYALVPETRIIEHRLMVPKGIEGKVMSVVPNGKYKLHDVIATVKDDNDVIHNLTLCQRWPIKTPRPVANRIQTTLPLITGQRVIDTFFPITKGGTAAIPGGFGSGKTMMQHQIAKWCDADIIIYVGCGERGNEITHALGEFSSLIDPKTNDLLIERTVLIANTSNMPVAAREASIYTGITVAEYFRDMGYHVAVIADSTSRWAEALREISGRLEEMPAEEGFPPYLSTRLSQFYERAGYIETTNGQTGSITIIGAVSPQGADFSEPVTQNTKRFVHCFWALDKQLAYMRHYPAINWLQSYTEYIPDLVKWYNRNVDINFLENRQKFISLLAEEDKLME